MPPCGFFQVFRGRVLFDRQNGDWGCAGRSRRGAKIAAVFVVLHRRRSCGMGVAGGPASETGSKSENLRTMFLKIVNPEGGTVAPSSSQPVGELPNRP